MNTNFKTPNLVIACYISGAGGKFLLNCLGISKHVVLQDQVLANAQLNGQLLSKDKHNILLERVNNTSKTWGDLGLGCQELFGDTTYKIEKLEKDFIFKPEIAELSNSELKFCLVSHDYLDLHKKLNIWPNANCILFENSQEFIQQIRPSSKWYMPTAINACWANIRGESWPLTAPQNLQEYNKLPAFIRSEVAELHNDEIIKHYNTQDQEQKIKENVMQNQTCLIWNCDWFLNRPVFERNIQKLYNELNLDDFDADLIMSFYDTWIKKLNIIEQNAGLV
jgi:hypothetical protein